MARIHPIVIYIIASICCFQPAMAEDATGCLKQSQLEGRTTFTNTCDYEVFMVWCHSGTGESACDDKAVYQRGRVMRPGINYSNRFSMPDGQSITMKACKGFKSPESFTQDGSGEITCRTIVDVHSKVDCGWGDVNYAWEEVHRTTKQVIVRLKTEKVTSVTSVDLSKFNAFEKKQTDEAPANFKKHLCSPDDIEETRFDNFKQWSKEQLQEFLENTPEAVKIIECRESLKPSKECGDLLDDGDPVMGVQG